MNGLVAQQRTDYTGKTVTRWVKASADGTPGIKVPSVKAKGQSEHLEEALSLIFSFREDGDGNEDMVNLSGNPVFYTPEFAREAMSKLPVAALRSFNSALERTPQGTKSHGFVAYEAYDHIREMHDMGQTGAAKAILARSIVRMGNTSAFAEVGTALFSTNNGIAASDYRISTAEALARFEGRKSYDTDLETEVNYSKVPAAQRERAAAYVLAYALHRRHGDENFNTAMVDLVDNNRDHWDRLVQLASNRGFNDMELIQSVLDDDNPALSEGIL